MQPILALSFKAEADLSDILTLVAIVISAYFGIRAMWDAAKAERKANTQRMLERWNSDSLSKHRAVAAALFRERQASATARIFLGDLMRQKSSSDQYAAVSELGHFFADLHSLWKEGALDDRLGCALFCRPIQFWWQFFPLVDSRESESDSDTYAADVNAWRRAYILPLHGQLDCAAKRCRFVAPVLERTKAIAEQ